MHYNRKTYIKQIHMHYNKYTCIITNTHTLLQIHMHYNKYTCIITNTHALQQKNIHKTNTHAL